MGLVQTVMQDLRSFALPFDLCCWVSTQPNNQHVQYCKKKQPGWHASFPGSFTLYDPTHLIKSKYGSLQHQKSSQGKIDVNAMSRLASSISRQVLLETRFMLLFYYSAATTQQKCYLCQIELADYNMMQGSAGSLLRVGTLTFPKE